MLKTTATSLILEGLARAKKYLTSVWGKLLTTFKKYANNVMQYLTYLDVDPVSCMPLSNNELAVRPCLTI